MIKFTVAVCAMIRIDDIMNGSYLIIVLTAGQEWMVTEMYDYIEREALPKKKKRGSFIDADFNAGWNACINAIASIPAADVEPVHYGCWMADREDVEWGNYLIRYRCSECKKRPPFDKEEYKFILSPYCPNCGAKMVKKGVE